MGGGEGEGGAVGGSRVNRREDRRKEKAGGAGGCKREQDVTREISRMEGAEMSEGARGR